MLWPDFQFHEQKPVNPEFPLLYEYVTEYPESRVQDFPDLFATKPGDFRHFLGDLIYCTFNFRISC